MDRLVGCLAWSAALLLLATATSAVTQERPDPRGTTSRLAQPVQDTEAARSASPDGCPPGESHRRLLFGLEPEVIGGDMLQLHPGQFANSRGCKVHTFARPLRIELARRGLNGMHEGAPEIGRQYFVYLVGTKDGQAGAVISSEIAKSVLNKDLRYAFVRKLPWGFVYFAKGIPAVHIAYWPKPFTRYTEAITSREWSVLEGGQAADWTAVDTSRLVPDNTRMAYVLIELRSVGIRPAAGFVRVVGSQGDGLMVGRVANGTSNVLTLHQRVTSRGHFFYRVEPGATMSIYVLGYSSTEPS